MNKYIEKIKHIVLIILLHMLCLVLTYLLALAGEPQSVWLLRDVMGFNL